MNKRNLIKMYTQEYTEEKWFKILAHRQYRTTGTRFNLPPEKQNVWNISIQHTGSGNKQQRNRKYGEPYTLLPWRESPVHDKGKVTQVLWICSWIPL